MKYAKTQIDVVRFENHAEFMAGSGMNDPDVIAAIAEDLKKEGIDCYVIQGSTKEKDRGSISKTK